MDKIAEVKAMVMAEVEEYYATRKECGVLNAATMEQGARVRGMLEVLGMLTGKQYKLMHDGLQETDKD